jgi:hypothetical protein
MKTDCVQCTRPPREFTEAERRAIIEEHEQHVSALNAAEWIRASVESHAAYLVSTIGAHEMAQNKTNPFEVEFFWDWEEFEDIAKLDLREDLLEKFRDDPRFYADAINSTRVALRKFADELDAILEQNS